MRRSEMFSCGDNNFHWSTEVRAFDIHLSTIWFLSFFCCLFVYQMCEERCLRWCLLFNISISTGWNFVAFILHVQENWRKFAVYDLTSKRTDVWTRSRLMDLGVKEGAECERGRWVWKWALSVKVGADETWEVDNQSMAKKTSCARGLVGMKKNQ